MAAGNVEVHETAQVHRSAILEGTVTIGAYTVVGAGTVIVGEVTVGDHCNIQCNVAIRGKNTIGNYVHIYDSVCIEQGRPAHDGSSTAEVPDESVIEDYGWINHGATMHGTRVGEGAVVGLNASLNYNCRVGKGAIVADGSACPVDFVVPDNSVAEGVPARIVQLEITDDDRRRIMGLVPRLWAQYAARWQENVGGE
ncbi:MAG: gamma carbonic anhydrase family protein [Planctomycetota bacterium]|jgi:UDP-N-acetylglucosamine acyltransferase